MQQTETEQLNTYQDLMRRFGVAYCTVRRWFHGRTKFKPTPGTVRIPESEVQQFIKESTLTNATKNKRKN